MVIQNWYGLLKFRSREQVDEENMQPSLQSAMNTFVKRVKQERWRGKGDGGSVVRVEMGKGPLDNGKELMFNKRLQPPASSFFFFKGNFVSLFSLMAPPKLLFFHSIN